MNNATYNYQPDAQLEPSYEFSTANVDKPEQFEAFCREFSVLGRYNLPDDLKSSSGFSARVRGYRLGAFRVVTFETDGYTFVPHPFHTGLYGEDCWVLTARLQGRAKVELDGEEVLFSGHRLELSSSLNLRACTVSDNQTMLIYLPRTQFAGIEVLIDNIAGSASGGVTNPLMSHYLVGLSRILRHLPLQEVDTIASATNAAIRSCLSYAPAILSGAPVLMSDRFELAKRYVAAHLTSPALTPESVCTALGMSRRQLYYMFEKVGGFYHYLRAQRLVACSRALLQMDRSQTIASVAAEFGFTDAARFSTAFRAYFGCSPRDYRSATIAAGNPSTYLSFLQD